jgi:hypothetical protein
LVFGKLLYDTGNTYMETIGYQKWAGTSKHHMIIIIHPMDGCYHIDYMNVAMNIYNVELLMVILST